MRILIASTFYGFPTSPDLGYGGMERVNWFLARELVKLGHRVTLLGGRGTMLMGADILHYPDPWQNIIQPIRDMHMEWDIVHDMSHSLEINAALKSDMKVIGTLENPNNPGEAINVVVPSDFSVKYTRDSYGRDTRRVYNAVADDYYPFYPEERQRYVAQVSVMEARKGVLESIEGAKQAGLPIHLAGLKSVDRHYQEKIDQYIDGKSVIWHGEVGGINKLNLMGQARANMLYVNWAEPGSMVGPESLSLGTPLIASPIGCVREYILEGVSGYVANDKSAISEMIGRAALLKPALVREFWLNSEFRADVMARKYLELYERVLAGETW